MDECDGRARPIAAEARRASSEMIAAASRARREGTMEAVDAFLDRWFVYEPGCNEANRFCDSPWYAIASADRESSFLPDSLGCASLAPPRAPSGGALAIGVVALVRLGRRRARAKRFDTGAGSC